MKKYQIISYDVWGNKKDGFEVNQAFTTSYHCELPDEPSDKEIKRALWDSGFCSRGILTARLSIEGELDSCLYVNQTSHAVGGFKPFCELRLVKEETI